MPVAICTVFNSWCWTERPSETCRVLLQYNKFETLKHLVGFTIEIHQIRQDMNKIQLLAFMQHIMSNYIKTPCAIRFFGKLPHPSER